MGIKFEGNKLTRLYSAEINSIAYGNQNAVLTGCGITAQSPATMTVDVDSGKIFFGVLNIDVSSTTQTIAANTSSYTRIDLIVVDNTGTVSTVTGTPAAVYTTPDYDPDNYVALAEIFVAPGTTAITSTMIKDIRTINSGGSGGGSGGGVGKDIKTFSSATTVNFVHNMGDENVEIQVFDTSGYKIIPASVQIIDENEVKVTFSVATSGTIVAIGGVSVGNTYYTEDFTSSTTWVVTHNLGRKYVTVDCYDTSDKLIQETAITSITLDNDNQCTIVFGSAKAGRVVVTGGAGTINISSASDVDTTNRTDGDILKWNDTSKKYENVNLESSDKNTNIICQKLNVTTSSAFVDLSSLTKCKTIEISNVGNADCYFDLDNSCATADFKLIVGASLRFEDCNFDYVSAITSTDVTELNVVAYEASDAGSRTSKELLTINATDSSSNVSFLDTVAYKDIIIMNTGNEDVYVTFGTTATVNNYKLEPDKLWSVSNTNLYQIAAICNTGKTTTVKILGVY